MKLKLILIALVLSGCAAHFHEITTDTGRQKYKWIDRRLSADHWIPESLIYWHWTDRCLRWAP